MDDPRPFFKNMLKSTFKTKIGNSEDISSPIVSAIEENTLAVKDKDVAKQISKPIVTALVDVMQTIDKNGKDGNEKLSLVAESIDRLKEASEKEGVEEVSVSNFPDYKPFFESLSGILGKIYSKEEKDIVFNEKEVDFKPVISELKKIRESLPKEKVEKDYSEKLDKVISILENKKDTTPEIIAELKNVWKSEDFVSLSSWLKLIAEKEEAAFEFTKEGRLKVSVDRVGLGGGGDSNLTNVSGEQINPATEEKQDVTAPYSISDLDESGTTKYYGFLKDDGAWYIMSVTATAVRYVKGTSGYSFASPSSLTYDTFSNTF